MKSHVFVADKRSLRVVAERGVFGVFAENRERPQWRKTRADILADLSCLRPGDRLFFYDIDDTAFWGIYEATTRPFYDDSDVGFAHPAPYRFGLRPFLPLARPIAEDALFTQKGAAGRFRSIFFKKVLNRGKACTHLFPDEADALTKNLLMQNDSVPSPADALRPDADSAARPPLVPEFSGDADALALEKELEWWLTHHIDSHPECRRFAGDPADIEMFANYVPITISGGNIDLAVYHRSDASGASVRYKISIIELKKGRAGVDALLEIEKYVRWLVRNVVGVEKSGMIQPILIARGFADDVLVRRRHWNLCERKPRLFRYVVSGASDLRFEEAADDS